nr:MAG TPA: hypothetical protein [Caudoviricetes sp.]
MNYSLYGGILIDTAFSCVYTLSSNSQLEILNENTSVGIHIF